MKIALSGSELALRDEVRHFLAQPGRVPRDLPATLDERMRELSAWQAACHSAGYVGRAWPRELGGGGGRAVEQIIIEQELAAAGAPEFANTVGLDVLGPALLAFGTPAQQNRYIPPILAADELWCQGFSEPDAGSDLASLRTRASDGGDHWIVNGQKTWVSWGHYAKWCGLLARTDDSGPKHRGISMLLVDMSSPGLEIRPMTQITGHAEFCEMFLEDVAVPKSRILGAPGDGWKIAMYLLGHERGTAALPRQVKMRTWLDRLVRTLSARELDGRTMLEYEHVQRELAQATISVEVLRHHAYRTVGELLGGGVVGPEGSSVKLLMAEAEQRLGDAAHGLLGPCFEQGLPGDQDENEFWDEIYLYGRAASIYGGTRQIQRNIVADRVLDLPQE